MKGHFFFIVLLLCSINLRAQKQTDHWYFGNKAGLNFSQGQLRILADSKMNAPAGSTSISNENGDLLFYSDGNTVWNRNHEIMENGTGLYAENKNTQTSIIIPKPNNKTRFYIFTTRKEDATSPIIIAGIYYSEIEISDSYPLGKVIVKNFRLISSTTEKITATFHKNGKDVWVITNGNSLYDKEDNSTIYAIKVSDKGIQTPITTELNQDQNSQIKTTTGQIKVAPDGSKIVITNGTWLYMYNFNNETGVLSNKQIINTQINFTSAYVNYGVSFSQNSKILYYATTLFSGLQKNFTILQKDLTIANSGAIGNPIYSSPFYDRGSLQIGSDGKIYVALQNKGDGAISSTKLGVINFPEKLGSACNFEETITLSPGQSTLGLPNFIQSYFVSRILTKNACYVDDFSFSGISYLDLIKVDWDFGDGTTKSGLNPTHKYKSSGSYIVKADLTLTDNTIITVYKTVIVYKLPTLKSNQELSECDDDTDGLSIFNLHSIADKITDTNLNEELVFYRSQNDLDLDNSITDPENFKNTIPNQKVYVKAINKNGCFISTTFTVNANFVAINNVSDYFTCKVSIDENGQNLGEFDLIALETKTRNELNIPTTNTVKFYPTYVDAQTNLNELKNIIRYKSSSIYIKIKEPNLGCGGIATVNLIVNPEPIINLQDIYTICYKPSVKPPVIISVNTSNDAYHWKDSSGTILSTKKDFILNSLGEFSLTVYKTENGLLCSNFKKFKVINPDVPVFSNIDVNTEDETNNIVDVLIDGNSNYEFSLDNTTFLGNSTSYTFTHVNPGLRTIYIRDINNCEQATQTNVTVIGFKKYFTPNGDNNNDFWNVDGLTASHFKSVKIFIFNRYGIIVGSITDFNSQGWDGTYNGKILASNNYWFTAEIIDSKDQLIKESGNFSLIRN
jgi:gliding motility-associated-like protein